MTRLSFIKPAKEKIELLNQKLLPHKMEYVTCRTASDVAKAIKNMVVRGAPAIGITAAYGIYLAACEAHKKNKKPTVEYLRKQKQLLDATRPTAVNLSWATQEMLNTATAFWATEAAKAKDAAAALVAKLYEKAGQIHEDDAERCLKMAQNAVRHLLAGYPKEKYNILTHCNTGSLATGGIGTALGVIRLLQEKGKLNMVYATETRPYLQGARITAWELQREKIPVTLTVDAQAGFLMQKKMVDAVFVGADRVAANGDVANKVGTFTLAVLARAHRIPFFVVAPRSTFDTTLESGDKIVVEERDASEVLEIAGRPIAPKVPVVNFSFDITPHNYITAIFSEEETLE